MSDSYNVKDNIIESGLKEIMIESFSKKFGISKEVLSASFDRILDKKLNDIGKNFASSKENNFGKIDSIPAEDFFNGSINTIKDE